MERYAVAPQQLSGHLTQPGYREAEVVGIAKIIVTVLHEAHGRQV